MVGLASLPNHCGTQTFFIWSSNGVSGSCSPHQPELLKLALMRCLGVGIILRIAGLFLVAIGRNSSVMVRSS